MAATQTGLGLTANVIIAAAMLAASSAAFALVNMTAVTMRQRQVPGKLMGRVTSLYGTVARGSEALTIWSENRTLAGQVAATGGALAPAGSG